MAGYVFSEHIFGRSSIKRSGSFYYLKWQAHKSTDISKVTLISRTQYQELKSLLGPVYKTEIKRDNHISYYHAVTDKTYYYVRKYIGGLKDAGI